jgi:hypothetical protein
MTSVLTIHLVVAYIVALFALFIGWVPLGRRVMAAIIGIQVAIGIVAAGIAGASHLTLPNTIVVHIVLALAAMGFYIAARRIGERPGSANALILSALGFLAVIATIYVGLRMVPNYLHG